MRTLAIVFGLMLIAAPAFAGPNPQAALAMHTVASYEYLYCPELMGLQYLPGLCDDIDNSATVEDLDASGGYVYVVFMAYNVGCLSGVEYCIAGWPVSRGAPPAPVLMYCPEGSLVLGNPLGTGGIQGFGESVCPAVEPTCGVVGFAYFVWGAYAYPTYLPVTLDYVGSAYSYPTDPRTFVLGPGPWYEEDLAVSTHGCTIWGMYPEVVPYADCHGVTATDPVSWSNVKAMYR
jgi:hypothetical protein